MRCATCSTELIAAAGEDICPRCSLHGALELSAAGHSGRPEVEGYELIEQIGAGGMGVVWLARDPSLDRLVALKLIPSGADPRQGDRLLREGQAAARVRHPHVVAVHALGRRGGSIFLAMEYLEGGNLEEALEGRPLTPNDAARLLLALADAVAHAHAEGVLHRDIKPSNVLLDGDRKPHLADFGLAAPREGSGDLTRPGQVLGTPAFLAPELLQGASAASPQSDVYGLGAVFYYALTGRPPFVADSVAAVLEQVRATEPPRPRVLKPDIPRDAETICLRSLAKNPAQRYESAQALRADVERYLRGEPILARPVGPWERAWRWRRRNPGLAAALGAAAALLLVLAVGGPIVALRMANSKRVADTSAAESQAISGFLTHDLLEQASPINQSDRDIKLRTVLDRAEASMDGRFQGQPLVEASLRATLAKTYWALGDFATMQKELHRAVALRRAAAPPGDRIVYQLMNNEVVALRGLGRFAEAEKVGRAALESDRAALGPTALESLVAMNNLIAVYLSERDFSAARDLGQATLAIKRRVLGPNDRSTLTTMINLSLCLENLGNLKESEAMSREAQAGLQKTLGLESPLTLSVMNNLADTEWLERKLPDADALATQTLALRRRVLGPDHPETLRTLQLLAEIQDQLGRRADAIRLMKQVVADRTRVLGAAHPDTREAMTDLAALQSPAPPQLPVQK